jgi:hypothetical protein
MGKDVGSYTMYSTVERLNGKAAADKMFGKKVSELAEFINRTGMLSSVDRHNLVRGALTDMADTNIPGIKQAAKAVNFRRVGFDTAERMNLVNHILVMRDLALKEGKNLKLASVREEVASRARAVAYDMNFAGDMPYNQNWASLFMQFAQVPHKAILQYTNRRLSRTERMKLAAMDVLVFGVPGSIYLSNIIGEENLPKDETARKYIWDGVLLTTYNDMLSHYSGEDVNVDFSSLSPFGLDGFAHMFHALIEGGFTEMLKESPAAGVLLKEDSRVQTAIRTGMRYLGVYDPYEGHEKPTLIQVAKDIAEISGGWSNYSKAKAMMELGKAVDKKGNPLNQDVEYVEAIAKMFGFGTFEEAAYYAVSLKAREKKKSWEADVKSVYDSYLKTLYRQEGLTTEDPEYMIKTLGVMHSVFKDDREAQKLVNSWLARDMVAGDKKLMVNLLKNAGLVNSEELWVEAERYLNEKGEDGELVKRLRKDMTETLKQMKENE